MSDSRIIYGFHAVTSRLRQDAGGVSEIYLDASRNDARARDLAKRTHGIANVPQQCAWQWRTLPVPVIAAVHGVAFGGGFQIMLGADMRYATADTRFSVMEIKWGLVPDLAALRGFRIGFEALAWGRHVHDWMQAWDLVRRADRPNLGVVLDSFHAFARKNPIAPMAEIPGGKIALVQVADAPGILMDSMSLSRHHRCFPGQGDWPIADFLEVALDKPVLVKVPVVTIGKARACVFSAMALAIQRQHHQKWN